MSVKRLGNYWAARFLILVEQKFFSSFPCKISSYTGRGTVDPLSGQKIGLTLELPSHLHQVTNYIMLEHQSMNKAFSVYSLTLRN